MGALQAVVSAPEVAVASLPQASEPRSPVSSPAPGQPAQSPHVPGCNELFHRRVVPHHRLHHAYWMNHRRRASARSGPDWRKWLARGGPGPAPRGGIRRQPLPVRGVRPRWEFRSGAGTAFASWTRRTGSFAVVPGHWTLLLSAGMSRKYYGGRTVKVHPPPFNQKQGVQLPPPLALSLGGTPMTFTPPPRATSIDQMISW